jgi:hypothetical protein
MYTDKKDRVKHLKEIYSYLFHQYEKDKKNIDLAYMLNFVSELMYEEEFVQTVQKQLQQEAENVALAKSVREFVN